MLGRVAGENLTAITVQHLYHPNLHCLVCCVGKGLEKCHSLCDSCTFQELDSKNICKPNKKELIEGCVMDQGKKTEFVTLSTQLGFRHGNWAACLKIKYKRK